MRGGTEMMAVRHAGISDAELTRAPDRFGYRKRARWKCEPAFRVDEDSAAPCPDDLRLRGTVDAAIAEMQCVLGDARDAVRREPPRFGIDERSRRGGSH